MTGIDDGTLNLVRENKYLLIKKKERNLTVIDYVQEEDFFKLQQVAEQNFSDLTAVKNYAKILMRFIDLLRQDKVCYPPVAAVRMITQSIIALIIDVTALTRSSYTESFEELFLQVQYTKPKKKKQKVMIEQYIIELLHKLLLFFWRSYFRYVYARTPSPQEMEKRDEIQRRKRDEPKEFQEYEKLCKFAHLLLILLVRNNKLALQTITEIDIFELLLEQIKTPWELCLRDLFETVGEDNMELNVLQKQGLKGLVDQLYEDIREQKYNAKILKLLNYVCAPGMRTDRRIQEMVLEMVVGRPYLAEIYQNVHIESK